MDQYCSWSRVLGSAKAKLDSAAIFSRSEMDFKTLLERSNEPCTKLSMRAPSNATTPTLNDMDLIVLEKDCEQFLSVCKGRYFSIPWHPKLLFTWARRTVFLMSGLNNFFFVPFRMQTLNHPCVPVTGASETGFPIHLKRLLRVNWVWIAYSHACAYVLPVYGSSVSGSNVICQVLRWSNSFPFRRIYRYHRTT